jgi:hypothetical protein
MFNQVGSILGHATNEGRHKFLHSKSSFHSSNKPIDVYLWAVKRGIQPNMVKVRDLIVKNS